MGAVVNVVVVVVMHIISTAAGRAEEIHGVRVGMGILIGILMPVGIRQLQVHGRAIRGTVLLCSVL